MRIIGLLIGLVLGVGVGTLVGQAAEGPSVVELLRQLDADGFADRQAAGDAIERLPIAELPTLEMALASGKLSPEAQLTLEDAIKRVRWREKLQDDRDRLWEWAEKETLGEYERVGSRDPRWDEPAREALYWLAVEHGAVIMNDTRVLDRDRFRDACRRAIEAGCDDPLVRFAHVRADDGHPSGDVSLEQLQARYAALVEPLREAGYSRYWVATAMEIAVHYEFEGVRHSAEAQMPRLVARQVAIFEALDVACEAARDRDMPPIVMARLFGAISKTHSRMNPDQEAFLLSALPKLEKAMPGKSFPYSFIGLGHSVWAYAARGTAWAADTPRENFQLMAERQKVAIELLEKAWEIDPTDYLTPRAMIALIRSSSGDREQMELWFQRALQANPNDYDICVLKLGFLEPKWHGNAEEMLAFGRECAETRNYDARIPLVLVQAHLSLSYYTDQGYSRWPMPQHFRQNPQAWADVQSVMEPYLQRFPQAHRDRGAYAFVACLSGKWEEADRQMRMVEQADPQALRSAFGRSFDMWRVTVDEEMGRR